MMKYLRKVTGSLLIPALVVTMWWSAGKSQDEVSRSIGRSASAVTKSGAVKSADMPAEEKLLRDVYARLMRYQSAAIDEESSRTGKAARVDDYLTYDLRVIHSGPTSEIVGRSLPELATSGKDGAVRIRRVALGDNEGAHAYYEAAWTKASAESYPEGALSKLPGFELDRYTRYRVKLHFQGRDFAYQALLLHDSEKQASGRPARVRIVDYVTSDMNDVYGDESPRVKAPWKKYVRTSLYQAVLRTIKDARSSGAPLLPISAPIGYLPGDDVSPNDQDARTMALNTTCLVNIQEIRYQDGSNFVAISGTLYILKGTAVTFKAIPEPPATTFSSGQPTWSGTSGATGSGETVAVTFNTVSTSTSDFKTVIATAGNTLTVDVIVYELTPKTTPQDNFANRSVTDYGLEEIIDLDFTTSPSITAAQAGGLSWYKKSGVGTVTATSGDVGTGTYDADDAVGTPKLALKVVNGPSKDQERTLDRNIIAPNDAEMTQQAGTGIRHEMSYIHVGFRGSIRLRPATVSFINLTFREGTVAAVASGCWASENGRMHPVTGSPVSIGGCNSTNGCLVNGTDTIECAAIGPYGFHPTYCTGDFVWDIPWEYSTDNGTHWTSFTTATHHQWAGTGVNLGRANIGKKGAGPFSRHATDPTSNY
jgi:hypothetical protein